MFLVECSYWCRNSGLEPAKAKERTNNEFEIRLNTATGGTLNLMFGVTAQGNITVMTHKKIRI